MTAVNTHIRMIKQLRFVCKDSSDFRFTVFYNEGGAQSHLFLLFYWLLQNQSHWCCWWVPDMYKIKTVQTFSRSRLTITVRLHGCTSADADCLQSLRWDLLFTCWGQTQVTPGSHLRVDIEDDLNQKPSHLKDASPDLLTEALRPSSNSVPKWSVTREFISEDWMLCLCVQSCSLLSVCRVGRRIPGSEAFVLSCAWMLVFQAGMAGQHTCGVGLSLFWT